ncbi:FecR family protein [Maribellus sp. YY47]|uniref:FecR family protein n=1 Tax=Maribellus sp. YY47 TaxID=2929486 RepID=UPI0020019CB4|nr:FecR family protein [Maribellus sp. YY47]MCK3683902.1 FecR family protein [Maribellus sp. YY47]
MNGKKNIDFSLIWKKIHKKNFEDKDLNEWLNDSNKKKELFTSAKQFYEEGSSFDRNPVDSNASYRQLINKIRRRKFIKVGTSAAAVLALAVSIFITVNNQRSENTNPNNIITPGTDKAILVLNNGTEIDLSQKKEIHLKEKDTKIASNGKKLEYHREKKEEVHKAEIIYNTLKVPRGGQFFLVLSDSTRVWLNSESELHYPVTFPDKRREVTLVGEAYFEVTKNKNKPFIVHSDNQQIEVLGTSFNVSAYQNNESIKTTLVEGRVKVNSSSQELFLDPSFQAVVDRANGNLSKQLVKPELYISWKDGNYYFENESFETILKTISRWYDFEYEFRNPAAKEIQFTGSINREQKIETIFQIIEETQRIKMTAYEKKLVIN